MENVWNPPTAHKECREEEGVGRGVRLGLAVRDPLSIDGDGEVTCFFQFDTDYTLDKSISPLGIRSVLVEQHKPQ